MRYKISLIILYISFCQPVLAHQEHEWTTHFSGCLDILNDDCSGATLIDPDLDYADMVDAVLIGANMSGADLSNTDLHYADLTNANLSNANLTNTNLTNAVITDTVLSGATWSNTTCPDGTNSNNHIGGSCLLGIETVMPLDSHFKGSTISDKQDSQ
jgi:uncharacterized protein YjbI with pentapeptide repeats